MKQAISVGRKYGIWLFKAMFLLALLLGGGKAQMFWERGLGQLFGYQNIFFYALMAAALGYAVCRFGDLYRSFQKSERKQGIWYAVYFSVSFTLFYCPLDSGLNQMAEFRRMIGRGVLSGVDVSKRIQNFHSWILFFAVSFVLFFLLANDVLQKDRVRESRRILEFAGHFIVLADVHLVFRCILFFGDMEQDSSVLAYSTNLVMLVLMALAAYLLLHLEKNMMAEEYAQLLSVGLSVSIPAASVAGAGWQEGKLLVGIQTLFCIVCIVLAKIGKKQFQDKRVKAFLACSAIFSSTVPFLTSFYIELVNILNQYGVFVVQLRGFYGVVLFCAAAACAVCSVLAYRKRWALRWWKRLAYPMLAFGISCLYVQAPLEGSYGADMFGTASRSVLIGDFLNFGSLPLAEHFSGHMMAGVWEGILYGILNQDAAGAIFSPYAGYLQPLLAVLFFYLVKCAWDEHAALFASLLFPFGEYWNEYGLGLLICLAVAAFVKKSSWQRAALVWFAVLWCALYRLETGAAFGIACAVSLAVYLAVYRKWNMVKPLAATLAGWAAAVAAAWFGACVAKGIRPAERLREFFSLAMSGANWAYADLGDAGQAQFAWAYIFLPFAAAACLLVTVFSRKLREQAGAERWLWLLLLGTAYFGFFSRGLAYGPLEEGASGAYYAIGCPAFLFFALFFSCLKNNRRLFLPVFTGLILYNNMFFQVESFHAGTVADGAAAQMGKHTDAWKIPEPAESPEGQPKTYWENIREKGEPVKRVAWEDCLKETIRHYQEVIDVLLNEDETFVDFTNQAFLYPALGRKNPAYVSQPPLQLAGEYAQGRFIEEMEGVPIVLMPMESSFVLDGIVNECRYYKVAEYIYQNYVPLCKYEDSFAVWCLSGRRDEMAGKVRGKLSHPYGLVSYGYDGPEVLGKESRGPEVSYQKFAHNYSIGLLPKLWASSDREKAAENPVAVELVEKDGVYQFSRDKLFRPCEDGNYLLLEVCYGSKELDPGQEEGTAEAELKLGIDKKGKFAEKYKFTFTLREGQHSYLFRVSSDYYWYSENINAAALTAENAHDIRMRILEGD